MAKGRYRLTLRLGGRTVRTLTLVVT